MRPEVFLAARWCHRQFLISPIDSAVSVFYKWSVDVFRLGVQLKSYSTFSAVLSILAVNLSLKQTFVSLTSAMTPSLSFHYCILCILPRCAF
jgi:hypothetical protein